jgi:hypothetical protein
MNAVDVTEEDRNKSGNKPKKEKPQTPVSNSDDAVIARHEELIRQTIGLKSINPVERQDFSKMVEINGLPSKMKQYPEGSKLYGRPLDLDEVKKLSGISQTNANNIIIDIIRSATKGIPADEILSGDKIYIVLWLRANTYPQNGYSVDFDCTACEKSSSYDFKVDDITVNYATEELDINEPVKLPNGDLIGIKYPTIADEMAVTKIKEQAKRGITKYDNDFLGVASAIFDINGEPQPLMERYRYIKNLKPTEYSYLIGYMRQFDMGVSEILNVKCNSCGGISPTELSFRPDFFIPTYRFGKPVGDAV